MPIDTSKVQWDEQPSGSIDTGKVEWDAPAEAPREGAGFGEAFVRGFKRSLPETKELLYGAGAAAAGAVGADNLRDRALANYRRVRDTEVAPVAGPSLHDVLEGDAGVGEYVGDVLGNFGGQAAQSAAVGAAGALAGSEVPVVGTAAGAVGGIVARGAVKKAITKQVERMLASQVERGLVKQGAEQAARGALERKLVRGLGGGAATNIALNSGQEIGITYGARADDAQAAGEDLTRADALRAIGFGSAAGLVDTAAEGLNVGRVLRGASSNPRLVRRLLTGAAEGAITEGGTEATQAALERAGAQQSLTDADARRDYIENFAAGAIGGTAIGAGGGARRRSAEQQPAPAPDTPLPDPANGPLSRVVNRAAETGALQQAQAVRAAAEATAAAEDQPVAMRMGLEPGATDAPRPTFRLPPPPWINPETGVIDREPDAVTAKAYVHDQLNRLEAAGEPIPNRGQWKRELGIASNLLANSVLGEVKQERAKGLRAPIEQRASVIDRLRAGEPATEADRAALGAAESLDAENAARLYADVLGVEQGRARKALEALPAGDDGRRATLSVLQAAQAALRPRQEVSDGSTAAEPAQAALGLDQPADDDRASAGAPRAAEPAAAPTATEPVARGADRTVPQAAAGAAPALTERAGELPAPANAESTDVARKRAPLNVRMGGQEFPVGSIQEASAKFLELRDRVGDIGGMRVVEVTDESGKAIGYIDHNGEVYGGDYRAGRREDKPIYDPKTPRRYAADVIDAGAAPTQGESATATTSSETINQLPQKAQPNAQQQTQPEGAQSREGAPARLPAEPDGAAAATAERVDGQLLAERNGAPAPEPADNRAPAAVRAEPAPVEPAAAAVHAAAHEAATSPQNDLPEPTPAQKEAGNYKKGHTRIAGLDISIENPAGSKRRPEWPALAHHYGYIRGTVGRDKDHVDVFLTERAADTSLPVFIVDQRNEKGGFDEHKVVLGARNKGEARKTYLANYGAGWKGAGAITQMTHEQFEAWVRDPEKTKRPARVAPAPATPAERKPEPARAAAAAPVIADQPTPRVRTVRGSKEFVPGDRATLEAYFKPGREVAGYGGKDRVISFDWNNGDWRVTVQGLTFNGKDVSGERPRTHSTLPTPRELRAVFGDPAQYAPPARAPQAKAVPAEANASPAAAKAPARAAEIQDVGEKIGGARKDQWRDRGLQVSDLAGMTGGEQAEFATKANVWKPDYAALVAGGADRNAVALVKVLWDKLPPKPMTDTAEARRAYVEALNIVKELLSDAKTVEQVAAAPKAFRVRSGREAVTDRLSSLRDYQERVPLYAALAKRSGYRTRFWEQVTFADRSKASTLLATDWPAKAKTSTGGGKAKRPEPVRPHLDNVPRTGTDFRQGKDVAAEDFRKAFGFRGVEFGNWAAQDERQKLVNLAFDGLHDMAQVLGIPPAAISLNGTLGLALGARGKGSALAHYEPGKVVINLTKINGAGALAHEWGHALDHYFGELDQPNAYGGAGRYISGGRGRPADFFRQTGQPFKNLRPEMQQAWADVLKAIYRNAIPKAEKTRELELQLEKLQAQIADVAAGEPRPGQLDAMRARQQRISNELDFARGQPDDAEWDAGDSGVIKAIAEQGLGPYWKRPTELVARSFEAYVNGKIRAAGNKSQYLVSVPTNPVWPQGGDLARVTRAFDKLFATVKTRETDKGVALFSKAGRAGSDRASWEGFPPAVIADPFGPNQRPLRTHPDYEAAKAGDRAAAVRLVGDRLTADAIARVRALIGDRKPTLVPVLAEEATGRNKIPLAYAEALGQALGLPVDQGIVQSVRAHHTASSSFHRIAFQAAFDGEVQADQDYLLLDDAITMGGTLANLRGHIEANGGRVIGATVLTGHPNGATMALQPATAQRLRETFGDELDRYLQDEFGFDSSRLTEGEAGHILKARTLDAVRDRIAQARDAAGREVDGRVLRSASDQGLNAPPRAGRSASGRLTLERARALQAELTKGWGDNAPSLRLVASAEDLPAAVRADPDAARIEGVYNGSPVIWLNVGAIRTERRFAEVLAHEVIGHYGVERVVGAEQWAGIVDAIERLDRSGGGSAQLRQIFADVRRRQPGLDRDTFAREAIAFMAENGIRNNWVNRVVAAVRRFLRQLMPSRRWTEVEVRALLAQADSFLRQRTTPAERRALVQRYAFSTDDAPGFGSSGLQVDEQPVDEAFVAGLTPKERRSPAMAAFAQALYRDLGTDSPFFREWFGDSKVVDAAGAPLKVYHGTSEEFAAFDPARAGKNTGHMTARLGIFFDARRSKAQHYAEIASGNVPADQRVIEAYLAIQKPYDMKKSEFMDVEGTENAEALRARLEREGYDGIRLPDIGQWIAFRADQIKATENRGTFDRGDTRMLFSKAPADVLDDITAVMDASQQEGIVARARAALADMVPRKLKDQARSTWLGALTTRHLTELGSDYFGNIKHYSHFLAEMGADRNQLQQEGEAIAEHARKWASKHRGAARQLFDLMHDATIDGVDPAEAFQPLQFRYGGQLHEATPKNIKEALAAIREQMRGRSGDNKKDMIAEAKTLRGMPARDKRRRQKYPNLVARWNQLPPEAQEIYRQFRDAYRDRSDAIEKALVARINDTDAPENHKRRIISVIRAQFESQRLQGVYFPLQRFGRYFVAAEKDGTPTFLMFERLTDLERAVKDLRGRGFKITAQGLKGEGKAQDAPSGTFVAEVIQSLQKAGVSDQTQDEIYQLYLQALPELSMRKHAIHRQSVPGFDPDAVRAFAFNMHHGAHQLARLRFAHKLQNVLTLLKQQQDKERREEGADTRKIAAGDAILNELEKRHTWIMNPQDSQLTSLVSSFGFVYYLGLTPAASLVNLTQTALVSYPYLAARYGGVRAMNHLLAGMRDSIRTAGHIQRTLTDPDELRAHAYLQQVGALDKTQAHNLAGIAEGGLTGYNPAWSRAMEIIGWGFHKTEVVNREATGLAAFRLAKSAGKSFDEAVREAVDAINDTHFDYTNQNRARFMQGGTAKVLLMFRQYSLNMTWHLGRMVWQATKGESPEVRRLARRNLTGLLGMSALFSGTLGLPLMSVTMGLLNSIASSFGDDDEPWDAETEFRAFLRDMLGEGAAAAVAGGVVNPVTGADVASRVSLSQLWFRDADRELDGRGAYYNLLEQAAGPMGGVLKNALVGKQLMDEGHLWRGVETVLPKAMKDAMRAARYASEGVNTLRGDPLVPDASLRDTLLQLAGFTPSKVADRYDRNRALKNYEQAILDRRSHLINAYAMATRLGDGEARREILEQIRKFSRKNPEVAITGDTLQRSLAQRARYSARAEHGITLDRRLAARVREAVGD